MKETKIYIRCPKCSRVLSRKQDGWNNYLYCKHCNKRYDVIIKSDEMSVTIKEHDDEAIRM